MSNSYVTRVRTASLKAQRRTCCFREEPASEISLAPANCITLPAHAGCHSTGQNYITFTLQTTFWTTARPSWETWLLVLSIGGCKWTRTCETTYWNVNRAFQKVFRKSPAAARQSASASVSTWPSKLSTPNNKVVACLIDPDCIKGRTWDPSFRDARFIAWFIKWLLETCDDNDKSSLFSFLGKRVYLCVFEFHIDSAGLYLCNHLGKCVSKWQESKHNNNQQSFHK